MIPVTTFAGKRVAVFGLGGSGRGDGARRWSPAARRVARLGRQRRMRSRRRSAAGIPVEDLRTADWRGFAALVLSPGVPLTHPEAALDRASARRPPASRSSATSSCSAASGARMCPAAPFIAITGTNGKSTTTALIAHLLVEQPAATLQLGGNIGTRDPVARAAADRPLPRHRVLVVPDRPRAEPQPERSASSSTSRPTISTATARSPRYAAHQGAAGRRVDDRGRRRRRRLVARRSPTALDADRQAGHPRLGAAAARRRRLRRVAPASRRGGRRRVAEIAGLAGIGSLRGAHNAAERRRGRRRGRAARPRRRTRSCAGSRAFAGLPHRMEEVGRRGRVLFVNDSKATNADAAAKALASFARIYWIAGGRPKEGGIASLARVLPAHRQGLPDRRGGG